MLPFSKIKLESLKKSREARQRRKEKRLNRFQDSSEGRADALRVSKEQTLALSSRG